MKKALNFALHVFSTSPTPYSPYSQPSRLPLYSLLLAALTPTPQSQLSPLTRTPHSSPLYPSSRKDLLAWKDLERKWNGWRFLYCRTATVSLFGTSIVFVIDLSSHFLDLLPRETLRSSGANHHTVPYPPKAVLWATGTVSTEHVFDEEMN